MITFRSARKLGNYLVKVKLYLLERTVRYLSIKYQFKIKKCLVFLLRCNKCFKRYVGKIIHRWWNNYKSNDRKFQRLEPCIQEYLFSHFSVGGHEGFLKDVSITLINKIGPSDPLRREDYWRHTNKTMVPYGLNVEDSV